MKIKSSVKNFLTIVFIIIVLIGSLSYFSFLDPVYTAFQSVISPIFEKSYRIGHNIYTVFDKPDDINQLINENEELKQKNILLIQQLSESEQARQENYTLRKLLDFFEDDQNNFPRVVCRIIGKDSENASVIVLNVGRRDGVKINNAVISNEGLLIAKIFELTNTTSKALLLNDSQSMVAVTLTGGTPNSKIASGERGLSLIMEQIPQNEDLKKGQLVITSGLEENIPRGLIVGEIEEILVENNNLFKQAILKPLIDYNSVYIGAVILSK